MTDDLEDQAADEDVVVVDYLEDEPDPPAGLPAGQEVQLDDGALVNDIRWEEAGVREHLTMLGSGVHELWGKAESDWVMSEKDLGRIAPPLTRILNRYEPTARAAIASDPILVAWGTGLYSYRSILQARAAVAEKREAAEQAVEDDRAGYERISGTVPGNGRRPRRSDLRFPEAARGAQPDEGE
jgi:hypothetical protein